MFNKKNLQNRFLKTCKQTFILLVLSFVLSVPTNAQTNFEQDSAVYFSDFELANNLAAFIEDGYIDKFLVLSAVVINDREGYYILVKLSNGETRRIFFNHVLSLTSQNRMELSNNYALLVNEDNTFEFFDKSSFNKNAFNAKIYISQDGFGQPYENQMVPYAIKDLALIDKDQNITNEKGELYVYLLSLQNGDKIFLTLKDAYESFNRNAFLADSLSYTPLGAPNEIVYFFSRAKERLSSLGSQIVIEIRFKNKIEFSEEMVAFQINKQPASNLSLNDDFYFLDIYFPNSTISQNLTNQVLPKVGVFDKILLTSSNKHKSSTLLRSYLKQSDYQFISELPKVEFTDEYSVTISYIQLTDQTSTNFEYAKAEVDDKGDIFEISNKFNNTAFYRKFSAAMLFVNEANNLEDINQRIKSMVEGIKMLDEAGASAVNDIQLINLVEAKQKVRQQIYNATFSYINSGLNSSSFDRENALNLIDEVEKLIINTEALDNLDALKNQLIY